MNEEQEVKRKELYEILEYISDNYIKKKYFSIIKYIIDNYEENLIQNMDLSQLYKMVTEINKFSFILKYNMEVNKNGK